MKRISSVLIFTLISFSVFSAQKEINTNLLNGPECTKYLKNDFKIKITDAYQICSIQTVEKRICLLKNHKKSQTEKLSLCHSK